MRNWLLIALTAMVLASCGSSADSTRRDNLSYLYGKGGSMQLLVRVYHSSPTHSTLYFKLPTRDLLYKSDGGGSPFRTAVRLRYETFADWNSKTPLDTASLMVNDMSQEASQDMELIGSIQLRPTERRSYILKVTARDLNRDAQSTVLLRVERDGPGIRQFFLPTDPRTGLPFFDDHLQAGTPVMVRSDVYAGRTLFASHYANESSLPVPVFTTGSGGKLPTVPDSTFIIAVDSTEGTFVLAPKAPGIFHLLPDTAESKGFSLFVLTDSYPYVAQAKDLVKPLRYITSMQEFDRITKSPSVRQAVERFWLDAAGDRERAREAIRIYYGRVENANRHFTTHVEGWRTDRGLVHIIFGTPNTIYRSESSESWIFGEENNLMSLTFTFTKRSGPFSDNDLVLQRDPLLKGAWYRNVESWRNGRVFQN
jgi:GWxTD domain-containing protein